ncbi:MAG: hypothetical protein WEA09_11150 [Gemmatimonadota bacterium]
MTRSLPLHLTLLVGLLAALTACGGADSDADGASSAIPTHDAFMANLSAQCGSAFAGAAVQVPEGDQLFTDNPPLAAHFWECSPDQVKIPFHVGENRSRTWILTRSSEGIDLRHDHRHEDGTPEANTMYGAHTMGQGTATRQDFLILGEDGSTQGGWAIEIVPGESYIYGTVRGGEWRYRLDFDLSSQVPVPPLPWGQG